MWIAGDQACIDRADRRAHNPVRFNGVFVQRVIDARLVGAERTSALQNQDDLTILLFLCVSGVRNLATRFDELLSMVSSLIVEARLPDTFLRWFLHLNVRSSRRPLATLFQ